MEQKEVKGEKEEKGEEKGEKGERNFPSLFPSQPSWKKGHQDFCLAGLKREAQAFHHHGCSLSSPQLSRLILLTPEPLPAVSRGSAEGTEGAGRGVRQAGRRGSWGRSAV